MNVHLLKILCDRIANLEWSDFSKQVVWTACTVCFYTLCRMGKLLAPNEKTFDAATSLKWENVKFIAEKEVLIFVPFTKTTGFKGCMLDVFPLSGEKTCPSAALSVLKEMAEKVGIFDPTKPVFAFRSGKFLTKAKLNMWLATILSDFVDENHKITGHSFRAAIPSSLASSPGKGSISDIKNWGNWVSDSYMKYTKQDREQKRALFHKIVDCLYTV